MPARYFEKFPTITYSNNEVVDITKRVALLERVSTNPYVFYPYEIDSYERADQLSFRYYDDQYKSWILYLSNKIVDPYYEWYMHENEFVDFITKKYGSYYDAQTKIKHYVNDWAPSEDISVSSYNALTPGMKNYWEAVLGQSNVPIRYKRKQVNWQVNTNKVIQYTVSNANSFINNEICHVVFDQYANGQGQVFAASGNKIHLQHVSGDFYVSDTVSITASSYVYGTESKANVIFTDVMSVANNIQEEELVYWKGLTYLEYETERNEFNKTVRVLDNNLKQTMVDNLTDLMSE